ncbi:MAG: peptide chain release factor N(5)-glutamine methyltransferase [Paludibacteraceae bacterium]|nr:peptide chain release factor N(5)-glutamine methyltransferase [Paludibacteraceae bacterium]
MKQTIDYIIQELSDFYPTEELRELAYWIVEETTGITRSQILMGHSAIDIPELNDTLLRLKKHEPIQYIFGHTQWMGLDLRLNHATLIPRPETAELVEWILLSHDHNTPLRIMDIGTGSGCIAIALKKHCPKWQLQGVDISEEALEIAHQNAINNGVDILWKKMNILAETPEFIDIIVSNPPYICHREKADMDTRVLDYEPHTALFVPDNDPLLFYRRIASMKSAKIIYFEINEAYGNEACDMMKNLGYTDIQLKHDIYGKARMVYGRIEA